MRKRALVVALAATALPATTLTVASPPAVADGTLWVDDAVLYDGCHEHVAHYDLYYPGAWAWEIDGTVYTADGSVSGGLYDFGDGDVIAGNASWSICDFEGPGWWSAEATVTWYDADYSELDSESLEVDFKVRRQPTRTKVTINDTRPRKGQVVTITVLSQDRQPSRWTANTYALVALDTRCDGSRWQRVRGSKQYTDARGRASGRWRWNVNRSCRTRAVTLRDDNAGRSYSKVKTWRTQRAAGRQAAREVLGAPDLVRVPGA